MSHGKDEEDSDDSSMVIGEKPLLQRYEGKSLTVKQVAQILNVSPKTVIGYVNDGILEVIPFPQKEGGKKRLIRIRGRSVDKWLHPGE